MLLLEGRSREVAGTLRARMERAAAAERFEEAARLRDQIQAIEKTQERQQVVAHWGADQDVFGLYREGGAIEVQVLFVRDGKLVSNQAYAFDDWELPDRRGPGGGAHAVLPGDGARGARRDPAAGRDLRCAGAGGVPLRATRAEGRRSWCRSAATSCG